MSNFCTHQTCSCKLDRGFTLIEALVAVSIVALAIAGPLSSASYASTAAQIANNKLTAMYLAQEGVEYVRAMRDEEYLTSHHERDPDLSTTAWNNFANGDTDDYKGSIADCETLSCTVDVWEDMGTGNGKSVNTCSNACPRLYQRSDGRYTQDNDPPNTITPFTRSVRAYDVSPTEERIVSTVSWSFHGVPYSVSSSVILTLWQ